jgi:hypothetical protein
MIFVPPRLAPPLGLAPEDAAAAVAGAFPEALIVRAKLWSSSIIRGALISGAKYAWVAAGFATVTCSGIYRKPVDRMKSPRKVQNH